MLDSALSAVGRLGRYFSMVTLLPTFALVLYMYVLLASGGGTTQFDLRQGWATLIGTSFSQIAWMLAASVILGLILHPLQFPLTQLLEGYWGPSRIGITLATSRVAAHRRRVSMLKERDADAKRVWAPRGDEEAGHASMNDDVTWEQLHAYQTSDATCKALDAYPEQVRRVMPTRLGNALRGQEDRIGTQYGLDAITIYPHLTHVADARRSRDAFDEEEQMDLALRLMLTSAAATMLTLVLLARTGWWTYLALLPYAGTYLAYRATCAAADAWMNAVNVMVDLDRFALYDALHVPRPPNPRTEATETGPNVVDLLHHTLDVPTWYAITPVPAADKPPAVGTAD